MCLDDNTKHIRVLEKECILNFLHGLNRNLMKLAVMFLELKEPLPSIREVFVVVQREKNCKLVMMVSQPLSHLIQPSSLTTIKDLSINVFIRNTCKLKNCWKPNNHLSHPELRSSDRLRISQF